MKSNLLLFFLMFFFAIRGAKAQSYTGYDVSSYTGVYGTLFNPANILDHRVRADVNLVGFSTSFQNNAFRLNFSDPANAASLTTPVTRTGKAMTLVDVMGPGFMFRLNDKNAFAVTSRFRFQANGDNIDKTLLNVALLANRAPLTGTIVSSNGGSIQAHAWNELALTWSRQIGVSDFGVWKAALSLKLLGGQGGAYLNTNKLSFRYNDSIKIDEVQRLQYGGAENAQGNININYSDFLDEVDGGYKYRFFRKPSVGADIGVTYEYRDVMQVYETAYNEETQNYKWKAGASVSDIGSIRYHSSKNSYAARLYGQEYVFDELRPPADSTSLVSIANFYKNKFPGTPIDTRFSMALPTTLHLTFDYSFNPYFSVASHFSMPVLLSPVTNYLGTHSLTQITVTPRAELSWAGVYFPFTYQFAGGFQSGLAFRLGPLTIGSASLIKLGLLRKSKSVDGYIILRVPFFKYRAYESEERPQNIRLGKRARRALNCPVN